MTSTDPYITGGDIGAQHASDGLPMGDLFVDGDKRARAGYVRGWTLRRAAIRDQVAADLDGRPVGYVNTLPDDPAAWVRDPDLVPDAPRVVAAIPDPTDAGRHQVRANGTVGKRGTVHVVGSLRWDEDAPSFDRCTDVRATMLDYVTRARPGRVNVCHQVDALTVTRWADDILRDLVAPLLGTDAVSWEQIIDAGEGADIDPRVLHLNPSDPYAAARAYGVAFDGPSRRHQVAYDVRGVARWGVDADGRLARRYVPCTDRVADIEPTARHQVIGRRRVTRWPTRVTLKRGRARTGDPIDTVSTFRGETRDLLVHQLVAPTDDAATRWHGHVLVKRPDVKRNGTRTARRAHVKRAETIILPDVAALERRAAALVPGARVRWELPTASGTVARAASGTWSVRVKRDDGRTVTRSTLRAARYVGSVTRNALK